MSRHEAETMTPLDWIVSGDTGVSSETIWSVMMGAKREWISVPHDPDDFGRCYRLLRQFPEWRLRLQEVADKYPAWGPLVAAWDELTAMFMRLCEPDGSYTLRGYEANKHTARALYDRMQVLIDEGRIADGWRQTRPGYWEKNK